MFCSCMTVHDHINIVHACTCVLMYVYVHVCVGCLIPHQLPLLDPSGLFAFLSDYQSQSQDRRGSIVGILSVFSHILYSLMKKTRSY